MLAVMVLAMNPLYFLLSLTFMTDVPFFTFSMFAFLFLLRALRTESRLDLMAGYAFSFAAILIRQLAIVIPLSFLVAYLAMNRIGLKTFRYALMPTTAAAGLLLVFPAVLRRTIGLPALYNRSFEPIIEAAPLGSIQMLLVFTDLLLVELIYIGLFTLPLLIALGMNIRQASSPQTRRLTVFTGPALFAALLGLLLWQGRTMPLTGNVLFDIGLGPTLLRDTYFLKLPHWPTAPKEFWLIVTAAAVLGSVLLLHHLLAAGSRLIRPPTSEPRAERARMIFLISATVMYAIALGITGFMDRYLFWLLPLLVCIMLAPRNAARLPTSILPIGAAVALTLVYGLFAVGGTRDYLAWNRTRWQALTDLVAKDGISYRNIDGGFEFNGWYAYDAKYRQRPAKSWWWVENDDYMVSFGQMPGYIEMRRYPFERWVPSGQGNILVLQRVTEPANEQAEMK